MLYNGLSLELLSCKQLDISAFSVLATEDLEVGFFVRRQVRALGEALVATLETTDVRALPSVRSQVRPEVEVETEAFLADVALVWLLSCVYQLVSLQF